MKLKKSIEADKSAAAVKAEQTSADSKDLTPRRRINVRMVQNVCNDPR
jgi:hypothetical protein